MNTRFYLAVWFHGDMEQSIFIDTQVGKIEENKDTLLK